jgi:CRP-like cAMP-binding protein
MRTRALTADELRFLRATLEQLGVPGRDAEPQVRAADIAKHEVMIREGGDPDRSGIVISGVVREYYVLPDGTERTRGFALEGDSFGSASDALSRRPSRVFVRAEAPTRAVLFPWSLLERLARTSLEWERLLARLIERLYLRKSVREYELLALDAMARYQSMLAQHPRLEEAVAQQHIASYLGITPVHLSRLRRRLGTSRASRRR